MVRKLGKGHCDAQAFVAKELPEPSLPPSHGGSKSAVDSHVRQQKAVLTVRTQKQRGELAGKRLVLFFVVVEWLYYSKRIIIVRWADLSDFFSLIFVGKMCVFVSRPMKIVTFLRKNAYLPKRVVDFPRERDTFRNKIIEIVEDVDEKSYNNNGKSWKSSRILRVNPFFSFFCFFLFFPFFSFFFIFSFFSFFIFFIFSFFFFHISLFFIFVHFLLFVFHFLSLSIIVYHCLSLSIIFFHFLCLCWVLKI